MKQTAVGDTTDISHAFGVIGKYQRIGEGGSCKEVINVDKNEKRAKDTSLRDTRQDLSSVPQGGSQTDNLVLTRTETLTEGIP